MDRYQKTHIAWVDLLRIIACFLVLISHSCDFFVAQFDNNRSEFLSGACWGSLVRPCVPLFVMISGVLLLPIRTDMKSFYSRRMKRIIIPLIFWSIVLPVLFYLYFSVAQTTSPNYAPENHTFNASLNKILTFIFNFNYDTTPFWYLYMLIGIYLFIPIIGVWLVQASKQDIKRFLWIWGVSLCLPYIQMTAPLLGYTGNYGDMGILGICTWNPYGTFYYFSGFLGYLVLAHYFIRFPLQWSFKKTLGIACILFFVGYAITLLGFILTQKHDPANYAALEIVWYFSGINVFLMTFAIFIIVQKIKITPSPLLNKTAALTFGIYLCHFVIVQAGYDLVYPNIHLPAYLQIPIIAIFSFIVSAIIIWLMKRIKILEAVTG